MGALSDAQQTGGESHTTGLETAGDQRTEQQEQDSAELSADEIFEILRNSRRRAVISYLRAEGEVSVTSLTRHVAAGEYDVDIDELSPDQHKRVYTGLYQCHLPRLDEANVIDFDKDTKTVSLAEASAQVEQYLYRGDDPGVARFELTAAVLVAAVISIGTVGVGPLGSIPTVTWAMVTVSALIGFALFQLYLSRGMR